MNKKDRYSFILKYFQKEMPIVSSELKFSNTYELLVAVILSAQCTDKRVNLVTQELFKAYPSIKAMAEAKEEDLYQYIKSVSYPNAKARHLIGMAQKVEKDFQSEVPEKMEDLIKLPGVGRKTANVIRAIAFEKPSIAVDTHVYRVSHRLGLVSSEANTPFKVENELIKNIPEHLLKNAHHWLLLHGRYRCKSRKPLCQECPFKEFCPKKI